MEPSFREYDAAAIGSHRDLRWRPGRALGTAMAFTTWQRRFLASATAIAFLGGFPDARAQGPAVADATSRATSAEPEEFPTPPAFTPARLVIEGTDLHYITGGSGPLVLLVHGFGQSWYEWHRLMPLLAAGRTVVAVDLPGLGQSGPPSSYSGQDVAEVLFRFARALSPDRAFDLVAHDIGIWNTYPMAARHPREIRRVVFMEAPIPDQRIYAFPAFTPEGESLVWHFSFFAAGDRLPETLVGGRERPFFEHFIKEHSANKNAFGPDALDLYSRSYAKPETLHAAFEYYRALNETVRRNEPLQQTKLPMPVLAIGGGGHGGLGRFFPDQMRDYAQDVSSVVLPGCGHWLPEECADALNETVVAFLRKD